jgi:hypothetical protein
MKRISARPIPVSESNPWDRKIKHLTRKGLTVKAIMRYVPLTESQIRHRQHAFHVSSMDYRQGRSPEAMEAIRRADKALGTAAALRRQIDAFLKRVRKQRKGR